jgi:hypothetical protein
MFLHRIGNPILHLSGSESPILRRKVAKTLKLLGYWKAVGDDVRNRSRQSDSMVMHGALEVNLPS